MISTKTIPNYYSKIHVFKSNYYLNQLIHSCRTIRCANTLACEQSHTYELSYTEFKQIYLMYSVKVTLLTTYWKTDLVDMAL